MSILMEIVVLYLAFFHLKAFASTAPNQFLTTGFGNARSSTGRYLNTTRTQSTEHVSDVSSTSISEHTLSSMEGGLPIASSSTTFSTTTESLFLVGSKPTSAVESTSSLLAGGGIISSGGLAPSTTMAPDPSSTVTSTMTTVPPKVSTQLIEGSDISTNTWWTTTKDDSSTILPVVWCPSCGGAIAIWELPPVPGVVFSWSAVFPNLPKFHLPCVKIFGQPVAGECPAPKTDENNEHDTTSAKSTTETSESKTSTSSCSGGPITVSDCRVGCSISSTTIVSESRVSSTTICYTTYCAITSGCSIEATTSTSITTSSGKDSQCGFPTATPYNAVASLESLSISIPVWMTAITFDYSHDYENYTTEMPTTTETSTSATITTNVQTTSVQSTSTTSSSAATQQTVVSTSIETPSASSCVSTASQCDGAKDQATCILIASCASWTASSTSIISTTSSSSTTSTEETSSTSTASTPSQTPVPTSTISTSSKTSSITTTTETSPPPEVTSAQPISTSTAPQIIPAPIIPLTVQSPICHNEADFPGHADISKSDVKAGSYEFCRYFGPSLFTKTSKPCSLLFYGKYDITYGYKVEWTPDCTTEVDMQLVETPIANEAFNCRQLLLDAYLKCNNGGVGGSIAVGCLVFTFTGGR